MTWYMKASLNDPRYEERAVVFFGDDETIVNSFYNKEKAIKYEASIEPIKPLIVDARGEKCIKLKVRKEDMIPNDHFDILSNNETSGIWEIGVDEIVDLMNHKNLIDAYDSLIIKNVCENPGYTELKNHIMTDIIVFDKRICKIQKEYEVGPCDI